MMSTPHFWLWLAAAVVFGLAVWCEVRRERRQGRQWRRYWRATARELSG